MCSIPLHARDVRHAWKTASKSARHRRRKDRAEACRVLEEVAETFGMPRLARLAGKIEARAR